MRVFPRRQIQWQVLISCLAVRVARPPLTDLPSAQPRADSLRISLRIHCIEKGSELAGLVTYKLRLSYPSRERVRTLLNAHQITAGGAGAAIG